MRIKAGLIIAITTLSLSAFAKIISHDGKLYLRENGKQAPLELVNELIKKGEVSEITLFSGGDVRMLSFSRKNQPAKIYSVDEKGFVYSLEPFSNYRVKKVHQGLVQFQEQPKKFYKINAQGFFIY